LSKKFVITGPESTGKSTLSEALAREYNVSLVKEYSREYLEEIGRDYELDDVLIMAKEQMKYELESQNELVFLDTDLTVFFIWIKEKYNLEIDWINESLSKPTNKIYFLCDIDIKWVYDSLREHPNQEDRQRLFNMYKGLLEKYNLTYHIISGDTPTRIKKCKEIIDTSN
jgi:nicotinamide riboside kinase